MACFQAVKQARFSLLTRLPVFRVFLLLLSSAFDVPDFLAMESFECLRPVFLFLKLSCFSYQRAKGMSKRTVGLALQDLNCCIKGLRKRVCELM